MDPTPDLPPGTYLIPRPIPRGMTFGYGLGPIEIGIVLAGITIAAGLWFGLHLFGRGWLVDTIALAPGFLGIIAVLRMDDEHIWEMARAGWTFRHRPTRYLYDWTTDDW
ncbi:MAG: hypothetical protein M0Z36_05470 [Thermaerobacter sp.]|nr:hypothetical protein [Thermaerobacter sp.]